MGYIIRRIIPTRFLAITLVCILTGKTLAGPAVETWTQRYDGPGAIGLNNGEDRAAAIAVDSSGNVYVVGSAFVEPVREVCATVAYSSTGTPLWTNYFRGDPNETGAIAKAIAVGSNGTVHVAGDFANTGTGRDFFTIAYSNAGVPLWTNSYTGGVNYDDARAIVIGGNGNVYVTGFSDLPGSDADYATVAYSANGTPLWTNLYNGLGNNADTPAGISVGGNGNVYVTGTSYGGGNSYYDFVTIAYSSSGTPLWTNRYNGEANGADFPFAIATDRQGNVFVTGTSYDLGGDDYLTIAYSSNGSPLWTNRYKGTFPSYDDQARAIVVDDIGNVYVTGWSAGNAFAGFVTIAYSNAGIPLWTNRYRGPTEYADEPRAISVDGCGNVCVTGISGDDYATVAYSNSGVPLWTNRFGGTNSYDRPEGLAFDGNGSVYVTGSSAVGGASADYDWVTIKYAPAPQFTTNRFAPDGSFLLSLEGGCNATYRIEVSTNLLSWLVLTNVTTTNGTVEIADPEAAHFPGRFYRAVTE